MRDSRRECASSRPAWPYGIVKMEATAERHERRRRAEKAK